MALSACAQTHSSPSKPDATIAADGGTSTTAADSGKLGGAGTGFGFVPSDGGVLPPRPTKPALVEPDFTGDVVLSARAARRVLYSWTTAEQYDLLRRDQVLLTRTERPGVGRANLRGVMDQMASGGDPLAAVLTGAAFQKGRFAWSNAWSTLRGWPGESYGDKLIRIELAPDAWLAKLVGGTFTVTDLNDVEIPLADALATPERIAAVFFQNEELADGGAAYCGTFVSCATGAYREYFVNNESQVASWSLATAEMRAELERSVALIEDFRDYLAAASPSLWRGECGFSGAALCTWMGLPAVYDDVAEAYLQACSISSAYYMPEVSVMEDLIAALNEALFAPDPLTVVH